MHERDTSFGPVDAGALQVAYKLLREDGGKSPGYEAFPNANLDAKVDLVVKLADLFRVRVADLVGENPAADAEAPEMVAMFRDLKQLGEGDRQTIRVLMEELKRRRNDQA